MAEADRIYGLSKETFALPLEVKNEFSFKKQNSMFGYKPAGTVKTTDKTQRPDSTEFFNIGKDCLHGIEPSKAYPQSIVREKPLLQAFSKGTHGMAMLTLRTLARASGEDEDIFVNRNLFHEASGDHIRLTRKGPSDTNNTKIIGLPSHTDFGSVRVLFNWLGGLQIESRTPGRVGQWEYVKPRPGAAIINLGDAMVHFSNGAFKSAKHRVVPSPGAQVTAGRISIVYFVRPTHHTLMQPVGKFDTGKREKVAGKFSEGKDRTFNAREWLEERGRQMAS